MGKQLSRRQFVKGAAVAIAGAALVHQVGEVLEPEQDDLRGQLLEAFEAMNLNRRRFVVEVARGMAEAPPVPADDMEWQGHF